MAIKGETLLGSMSVQGGGPSFRAFDPSSRQELDPEFHVSTEADVDQACQLAEAAFQSFGRSPPSERALLLETIAQELEGSGNDIVARAMLETGLPEARLRGELGRTTGQLRMFARVVKDGAYLDIRIDRALLDRSPPRPDIRLMHIPLGPVAVFGASNFPLAFSVAGGDTASALAAGCSVVVKAHPAHPGTSELVGRAVQRAVAQCGVHEGVFSLLFDAGIEVGARLVANSLIQAVGFTGSRQGGQALMRIASSRAAPIPVYAEMSSINPVVLLPAALAERGCDIGKAFVAAQTMGSGQFCTNPGLLLAIDSLALDEFVADVRTSYADAAAGTMLTPGIHFAYCEGVEALKRNTRVRLLAEGQNGEGLVSRPALFETTAGDLLGDETLVHEVFGASSILVRCADVAEMHEVIEALEGQLTAAVHFAPGDRDLAASLLPLLERKAGRILFDGFGTGVEVCDAMVHGGPYPATSDSRSTSVGSLAIMRFLRPVSYQNVPSELLPAALRDENPFDAPRLIGGERE